MSLAKILIATLCLCLIACGTNTEPTETITDSGIRRQEVWLDDDHRIWIYKPEGDAEKRPLVLVAPAGSPMYLGMSLSDEDMPEHEPYVRAGCVVVAYDVSGPEPSFGWGMSAAIRKFMESEGGVEDGRRALDYALENIPEIDPSRVIAAGHSSAATIALQLARAEPRVKACVAYAPCVDTVEWLKSDLSELEDDAPGFRNFAESSSLLQNSSEWTKPCFLFVAADDGVIDPRAVREFARRSPGIELFEVPSGNHYDSMIVEGIPMALDWLREKKLLTP